MLRSCAVLALSALAFTSCGGDEDASTARTQETPQATSTLVAAGDKAPGSVDRAAAEATPPIVDCATHVEPSVERFEPERDVVRGPFALVTVRSDLPRLSRASYQPRAGRLAGIKLPVGLHTGHTATLQISTHQRKRAALLYRDQTRTANRVKDGDAAVSFEPCSADTPAFLGGTVGPITGWAGALIVTGPGCFRLKLHTDGKRRSDIRLPLGRRCR